LDCKTRGEYKQRLWY